MQSALLPWPQHVSTSQHSRNDRLIRNLLAILLPPLAVKLAGQKKSVGLSILLTFCGWVPGVIHARRLLKRANQHDFSADQLVSALAHHVRR